MKRKILIIALALVLAMTVSALIGCTLKVTAIELVKGSLATEYYVGETVDMSQAKIKATYNDGTEKTVTLTESMLNAPISTAQADKKTYTITYEGKTYTFDVEVKLPTLSIKAGSFNTNYYVGDEVSYNGAKIVVKNGDATGVDVDLTAAMVSPAISTAKAGTTTHTITYNGATTTFDVTVRQVKEITNVGLNSEYIKDEPVDLSGVKITVKRDDNTTGEVALTWDMIYAVIDGQVAATHATSIDTSLNDGEAEKTLNYVVKFGGQSKEIEITVKDTPVKSIAVSSEFVRDYYIGYTSPDFAGKYLVVTLDNAAEDVRNLALTNAEFEPVLPQTFTAGTHNYTLTYGGKTTTLTINVYDTSVDPITISLATGNDALKTVYNPKEQVSLNGKIEVSYPNGTNETIDITSDMLAHSISTEHSGRFANTISYWGASVDFDIVVKVLGQVNAFSDNSAYTSVYEEQKKIAKPVTAEDYTADNDGVLSDGSFVYEVGNVNKFKFEPLATGYDANGDEETFERPFVKMRLYIKETLDGQYSLLTAEEAAQYVTVTDNVYYAFANEAVARYFKMELTLDDEIYDNVSAAAKKAVVIEFKVVDGYNVYDALGLSAYDNLNKKNWQEIKQVKLECDDKTLYEYNDQIKLVVLHNSFAIDPMFLPLNYFWDKDADYQKQAFNLTQQNMRDDGFGDVVDSLNGTLRDGEDKDGKSYKHGANQNTICVNGIYEEDYIPYNQQKGLYNTTICDVSGNGMQISVPQYNKNAARNLIEVYGTDAKGDFSHAIPHWALFRMHDAAQQHSFSLYNLRLDGNTPRSEKAIGTAGINMINVFAKDVTFTNVCATGFYADITLEESTGMNLNSSKLVDSYNSMFYMLRSHASITMSVLRKSGGPLILMDAGSSLNEGEGKTDSDGCVVTVDTDTVLECYAAGTELWYQMYTATGILTGIKSFNGLTKGYLGKNLITTIKEGNKDVEMLNMIAAITITPGDLMDNHPQGEEVAFGRFDKVDKDGNVVQSYAMHDPVVQGIQSVARTAIFQSGGNYAFMDSGTSLANPMGSDFSGWTASNCDTMCVYMHAGLPNETDPSAQQVKAYFGIILGL